MREREKRAPGEVVAAMEPRAERTIRYSYSYNLQLRFKPLRLTQVGCNLHVQFTRRSYIERLFEYKRRPDRDLNSNPH